VVSTSRRTQGCGRISSEPDNRDQLLKLLRPSYDHFRSLFHQEGIIEEPSNPIPVLSEIFSSIRKTFLPCELATLAFALDQVEIGVVL